MRTLHLLLIACLCFVNVACNPERTINGRSEKSAAKSVKIMKEYLPPDMRVEFELAYWTTRDALRDSSEFLAAVNGKSAAEMIAVGREYFAKQKAAGMPNYDKYASWDEMVAKLIQERKEQSFAAKPESKVDKNNNVLYKLAP